MRPRSRKERLEIFMERQRRHFATIFAKMNNRGLHLYDAPEKMVNQSRRIALIQGHKICLVAGDIEGCKRIQKELDGIDVYE